MHRCRSGRGFGTHLLTVGMIAISFMRNMLRGNSRPVPPVKAYALFRSYNNIEGQRLLGSMANTMDHPNMP